MGRHVLGIKRVDHNDGAVQGQNVLKAFCSCGWTVVSRIATADGLFAEWAGHVAGFRKRWEENSKDRPCRWTYAQEDLRGIALRLHQEIREAGEKIRELAVELRTELPREADLGQLVDYVVERVRWAKSELCRIEATVKEVWPNSPGEYDVSDVIRHMDESEKWNRKRLAEFLEILHGVARIFATTGTGFEDPPFAELPDQVSALARERNDARALVNTLHEKLINARRSLQ